MPTQMMKDGEGRMKQLGRYCIKCSPIEGQCTFAQVCVQH